MTFGKPSLASALALAALAVAAPSATAFPTGSFGNGDGREVVIIDGKAELSDLDRCWASGFPRDITFDNRSKRDFLVFATSDCTGEPTAVVPPGTYQTHYGWSAVAR
ncbi:hypothetical protein [Nocardia sp. NPDC050406]|uniref:hypothetical protein n=1 Tax=Nocardia sp. NPDC050406 TaxID=3364318 RepID=UPI0037874EA8